jgi:hypothetical protein
MAELRRCFEKSSTFTDASSLGNVRGAYPLDLFTLVRAYHLHEAHPENDLYIYVLVMALWVEALENRHFSLDTRYAIIGTLLFFFCIQESLMDLTTLRERPNRLNQHVTFATCGKARRSVCTLVAQLITLQSGNSNLNLDYIGSHTVENYVGNIRLICHRDNRAVTVERQVSLNWCVICYEISASSAMSQRA